MRTMERLTSLTQETSPILPPTVERRCDRKLVLLTKQGMNQGIHKIDGGLDALRNLGDARKAVLAAINTMDTEYRAAVADAQLAHRQESALFDNLGDIDDWAFYSTVSERLDKRLEGGRAHRSGSRVRQASGQGSRA